MTESVAPTPPLISKIISSRVFRGPNIWHYEPAIQLVVDLGVLEDFPDQQAGSPRLCWSGYRA